jgi:hypothetical protein
MGLRFVSNPIGRRSMSAPMCINVRLQKGDSLA